MDDQVCLECPKLSSPECAKCDHFPFMGQVICTRCENYKDGECSKCAKLRAFAALLKGIAECHSLYELTYLGVELRTVNSLEKHLGIIWLSPLLDLTADELKAVPNIGDIQVRDLCWALNHYDRLDVRKQAASQPIGDNKRAFDEKYRFGGVEFAENN